MRVFVNGFLVHGFDLIGVSSVAICSHLMMSGAGFVLTAVALVTMSGSGYRDRTGKMVESLSRASGAGTCSGLDKVRSVALVDVAPCSSVPANHLLSPGVDADGVIAGSCGAVPENTVRNLARIMLVIEGWL